MEFRARGPLLAWWLAGGLSLVLAGLFRESFFLMFDQWSHSSTFSYGFLVLPLALWLLWRVRHELARVPPEPGWLALLLWVPVGACWALGTVLEVNVVQQFAAVLLVLLGVVAVLGPRAFWVMVFPLGYTLLMVPCGDFMVPFLMGWTADFAVLGVGWSGVPVFQDGLVFSLPGGDFEVLKVCSGIRFLMATLVAGVLFAGLAYRSWYKRGLFLLACLLVPIGGNLLRAWGVVMLVHWSDGRLAGEHVLYGTLFFGAVLLGLFVLGARYADPPLNRVPDPRPPLSLEVGAGRALAMVLMSGCLAVLLVSEAPVRLAPQLTRLGITAQSLEALLPAGLAHQLEQTGLQ